MPIEHGVHGADGGTPEAGQLAPEPLAELRGAPRRIRLLEAQDGLLHDRREPIRVAVGPSTAVGQRLGAAVLVAIVDLVARLAGDPELRAQVGHLLAIEQAGDEPETLVDHVTLLPRHAPS